MAFPENAEEDGMQEIGLESEYMNGKVGGVDACQGDSGGPLWRFWNNKATQVTIVL